MVFSNGSFYLLSALVNSYIDTRGIVDKIWLVQSQKNPEIVDKYLSLRDLPDKLLIHEAKAAFTARTETAANGGTAITSLACNKPTGTAQNDIMFAWIGYRTTTGGANINSVPTGWTVLASSTATSDKYYLYYKVAGASEGTSYTWGVSNGGRIAITITTYYGADFDPANPIDVVSSTAYRTSNTSLIAASMNVTAANSPLIFFGGAYTTTVRTFTKPSVPTTGWVEDYDAGNTTSDYSRTIDSFIWSGSGATGAMAATISAALTTKHAFAVALNPPNLAPTLSISQPDGVSDTVAENSTYNITYSLADASDVVTAKFFYDTNASGLDGTALSGACASAAEGAGVTCSWDTTGISPGSYYIYATSTDGVNPEVSAYSSGTITIDDAPTLSISQPDGTADTVYVGDAYNITYSLADTDDVVTAKFFYDTNASGLDGTALSGACAATGEATTTCAWDTTGMTPGSYYVYATSTDGLNAQVNDYSPGTITINAVTPDATSYTVSESALNYANCATTGCGGRLTQTVTLSGTLFGSSVTNKDTCTAGTTNGCIRIGNYTVPAANVSTWNSTQIVFTVPAAISVYGGSATTCGASGSGVCVTQNGVNDTGGALEFWVFPNITSVSPSGAGEGKEGDSITISGSRFNTSAATGTVVFQNCAAGDVAATITSWSDTAVAVTVPTGIADDDDACDIKLTRAAGTGSKTASSTNFVVLPQIDSIAAIAANAGRTYDAADTDGLIMLIGRHFGTAGSVTILGSAGAQHASAEGQCSFGAYRATTTCREVPNVAGYTGNVVITRTADSKNHTYAGTFSILPRITGFNPASGTWDDAITVQGNHFCQNGGSCPTGFDGSNKVTFTSGLDATVFTSWTDNSIVTAIPTNAVTGNVTVTSNTYISNGSSTVVISPVPSDPTAMDQFKDAGLTQVIAVGGVASSGLVYLKMTMQAGVSGGTLYPQFEVTPALDSFVCGAGACGSAIEGIGHAGAGPVTGTTSTSTVDDVYHWQARVRHNKGGVDYYSAWVAFGGNGVNATDFQIDATGPGITFPGANTCADAATSLLSNSATISWNLSENGDGQLEYATSSSLTNSVLYPAPPEASAGSHAISLSNLDSGTTYYFRVKSVDGSGNLSQRPANSPFCSFTTLSVTDPGKTTIFYINGTTGAVSSYTSSNFLVHIPEAVYEIKSAFVELTGVTAGAGTNNMDVSVNGLATSTYAIAAGESFFRILYPVASSTITIDPSTNTLGISPSMSTNIVSAQIYVTYSFEP
jgi:hypothetical protein